MTIFKNFQLIIHSFAVYCKLCDRCIVRVQFGHKHRTAGVMYCLPICKSLEQSIKFKFHECYSVWLVTRQFLTPPSKEAFSSSKETEAVCIHSADELKQRLIQFYSAPATWTLSIWLLTCCVKGWTWVCLKGIISSTSCELTHNGRIWHVLCEWRAQIIRILLQKRVKNVDIWSLLFRQVDRQRN